MKRDQEGIAAAHAGLAAALVLVLTLIGLWVWRGAGREYPQVPWLSLAPMVAYIVMVLFAAWKVRQYVHAVKVQRSGTVAPTPQQARGTLVAAQAGAVGGAALSGFYVAHVVVHVTTMDVPSAREMLVRAAVSAVVAAAVSASGFAGQWMCRLPEDEEREPRGSGEDGMAIS